jgi:hypothetical protein
LEIEKTKPTFITDQLNKPWFLPSIFFVSRLNSNMVGGGGHNLPLPLLVGTGLLNLSNSEGTIASSVPGSYALYSTEMPYEGPKIKGMGGQ